MDTSTDADWISTEDACAYLSLGRDALASLIADSERAGIAVPQVVVRSNLWRWRFNGLDEWLMGVCAWRESKRRVAAGLPASRRDELPKHSGPKSRSALRGRAHGSLIDLAKRLGSSEQHGG